MPPLSVLIKPSSGMCNMHCDYCFYEDETAKRSSGQRGFMSEETLRNVIRKTILRAEGSVTYAYQGGEPSLRGLEFFKKAVAYQKQYNKRGIRVFNAFQTNGYLLDDKWCKFFRDHHFLLGLSIDGIRKTHDLYRHTKEGGPTYNHIVKAAKLLDSFQVEYNILTVVTRQVVNQAEAIYQSYREHGWKYQQYIACLDPLGEPHGQNEYALHPGEYGKFLMKLFDLWYEDYIKGQAPCIRQFENYIQILCGLCPESCEQTGRCGSQIVVEADGNVYPCDFYALDEYCIGNFNRDRLPDIDRKRRESGFIERSERITPECRQCEYHFICRGGCQRNREYSRVKGGYENYFCEGYRMFFTHSLERMKEIARYI